MWLTRFAIDRPVIVLLATIGLMVFGLFSYLSLGRNLFPNVDFPAVAISAGYPGASPSEMERLVVKPIEDQLDGMQNLKQINAGAQEGTAMIYVQFNLGTNLDTAASDVQQRVETARAFMPSDLNPPYIERQNNTAEPIVVESLVSRQMTGPELGDLVKDRITSEIKALPGVQNVVVNGQPEREFHVLPDQQRMLATGYTLDDLLASISRNNSDLPGGRIDSPTSETSVSVRADVNSAADIGNIPLFNSLQSQATGGNPLHLSDIARVEDSHVEQRQVSHFNGNAAVYLDIQRQTTSDTVRTTAAVRDGLRKIAAEYPQIHFQEIEASADYTEASINGVLQSLMEGIFLTALVMLLFLHAWRNAIVVMVAIPTSLLATFIMMRAFGFTVDIISMMGLGLTIGILVDDSIVVLENITRHRDIGEDATNAAITGRTEIGNAAIAITLVDVIVFTPIAFMSGIVGEFMREFGLVIVVATLFSLLVSFTLTPLLAARWSVRRRSAAPPRYLAWFQNAFDALQVWYSQRALPFSLRHGTFVGFTCLLLVITSLTLPASPQTGAMINLAIAAAIFAVSGLALLLSPAFRSHRDRELPAFRARGSAAGTLWGDFGQWLRTRPASAAKWIALAPTRVGGTMVALAVPLGLAAIFFVMPKIGFEFIPSTPTGVVNVSVQFPQGQPLAQTQASIDRLEQRFMKIRDVQTVLSTTGSMPAGYGSLQGGNFAKLTVISFKNARSAQDAIGETIRSAAPPLAPGGKITVAGENGGSGAASPIFYNVAGPDSGIGAAADRLAAYIRA
ncbi:MAG: efflux RND transporter permease subunit, partial [Candidatus Baltobacteraceae bacterium]